MKTAVLIFPLVVLLAALRARGVKTEPFMITAHIYTGLLMGLFLGTKKYIYFWAAVVLTLVEGVAFFAIK